MEEARVNDIEWHPDNYLIDRYRKPSIQHIYNVKGCSLNVHTSYICIRNRSKLGLKGYGYTCSKKEKMDKEKALTRIGKRIKGIRRYEIVNKNY